MRYKIGKYTLSNIMVMLLTIVIIGGFDFGMLNQYHVCRHCR